MKTRILALVLSVAMVLGAVSFTAFADTNATADYAAGEGAYYLFDVPEAGIDADKHTTNGLTGALTVVNENGENFIKFDQPYKTESDGSRKTLTTSIKTAQLTYGAEGLPSSIVIGDGDAATTKDLTDTYIAVRMKINDFSPAFSSVNAATGLGISVVSSTGTVTKLQANNTKYRFRWLDVADGSLISFLGQSGYNKNGKTAKIEFSGDMDGYLFIPFACLTAEDTTAILLKDENFRDVYAGLQFDFFNTARTTAEKESSWLNKEFLLGDAFIVNNLNEFAAENAEKRNVAGKMYRPNGDDTASYAIRVGGFRSYLYLRGGQDASKSYYNSTVTGYIGSYDSTYHIATLSNGDRAYEYILNKTKKDGVTAMSSGTVYLTSVDTYDEGNIGSNGLFTTRNTLAAGKQGVPATIDVSKITHLAYRIATKDGTIENETVSFSLTANMCKTGASTSSVTYKLQPGEVTYLNVATGAYETLKVASDNSITYEGNLDGYLIIPIAQFGSTFTTEAMLTNWGGYVDNNYNHYATSFSLKSGFNNGKAFYAGDVFFVEDASKFRQYHCPHVQATAGERVSATCQQGAYTPLTCDACAHIEKTAITETVPCNHDIPVAACEPTCEDPGMTSGAKCSWCNEYSIVNDWVDPLGHDMKAGVPVPAECEEDGYTVYTCQRKDCGHKETRDIVKKLGHEMVVGETIPVSCQIDGYTEMICTNPGCTHTEQIDIVKKIECNKDIHVEGYAATCTHAGKTDGKRCSMCNMIQEGYEPIWATEHDNKGTVEAVAPTCDKQGHEAGKCCSICGKTVEGADTIKKLPHNSKFIKKVAPTEVDKGYDLYECKDCGATEKKNVVPALGITEEEYEDGVYGDEENEENPSEEEEEPEEPSEDEPEEDKKGNKKPSKDKAEKDNTLLIIIIVVAAVLVLGGGAVAAILIIKKKKGAKAADPQ